MEKEQPMHMVKYSIADHIENLALLHELLKISKQILIFDDLKLEPFIEFSLPFQAEYWYLKYHQLRDRQVKLELGEFKWLFEEENVNVIWLSARDGKNFILECKDGNWFVSLIGLDKSITSLFDKFKLNKVPK